MKNRTLALALAATLPAVGVACYQLGRMHALPAVHAQEAPVATGVEKTTILGPTVFKYDRLPVKKSSTGEVRSVVKQPTATVDELEMHITTLNPGQTSHQPHRHVNEELIIMDSGECETLSEGKWIKVTKGDIVFNASNSLHQFRNSGKVPATYHVINWSPNKDMAAKK